MMNHTKSTPQLNKAVKYWALHLYIFIRGYLQEHTSERDDIMISVGCISKFETSNKIVMFATPLNTA